MADLHIHTDRRPSTSLGTPPFSPYILTPEQSEEDARHSVVRGLSFSKHPIPSAAFDSMTYNSAYDAAHDKTTPVSSHKPVSLLSAMMSSPEAKRLAPRTTSVGVGGIASAQSSVPSTTISSPVPQPHGILQHAVAPSAPDQLVPQQPTSILRRGSTSASSDAGEGPSGLGLMMNGLGMLGLDSVNKKLDKLDSLHRLEKVEERRERIEWADELQRNVSAQPVSRTPSQKGPALKFAVAPLAPVTPSGTESQVASRRPSSPFARERAAQINVDVDEEQEIDDEDDEDEEEETEEDMDKVEPRRAASNVSRDENDLDLDDDARSEASSVGGYDEDEEDGAFESDEDWPTGFAARRRSITGESSKFPFARPTNYDPKHPEGLLSSPNGTPPAGPMLQLPPTRRGRGHIKVDPAAASANEGNRCSRHCSPPPQRSRSNSRTVDSAPAPSSSPSARRLKRGGSKSASPARTDDAGPRGGRAGSPMPRRLEVSDEEESESNAEEVAGSLTELAKLRGGWRSDDSVFYGPNAQRVNRAASDKVAGISRNISAPPTRTVFEDSDDEPLGAQTDAGPERPVNDGMRGFLRRASEHLQGFARPIIPLPAPAQSQPMGSGESWHSHSTHLTADAALMPSLPSKPILDETPVIALSVSPRGNKYDGGLAHRLEKALAVPVSLTDNHAQTKGSLTNVTVPPSTQTSGAVALGRTKSLGSKVTFGPPPTKEALLHRASTTALAPGTRSRTKLPGASSGSEENALSKPIACQSGRKLEKIRAREYS